MISEFRGISLADIEAALSSANDVQSDGDGTVVFTTVAQLDPWIRYFFYATSEPDPENLDGYRFQIFPTPVTASVTVRTNRSDLAQTTITVSAPEPRASNFRTRWGSVVYLTETQDSTYVYAYDPATKSYYLTLDGYWQWSAEGAADPIDLLAGLSGMEYVHAPASWLARFIAGSPAFAPYFRAEGSDTIATGPALLSPIPDTSIEVTTAWFYTLPSATAGPSSLAAADSASYYSQPGRAPLFTLKQGDPYLWTFDLETAPLPPNPDGAFPIAPYAGAEGTAPSDQLRRFEDEVLSVVRAQQIYGTPAALAPFRCEAGPTGIVGPSGPVATAVTPQGLMSVFGLGDETTWEQLILGQANDGRQLLRYTEIEGQLREALLTNQLFLVVSNPEKLYKYCSTTYCITDQVIAEAKAAKVPDDVCNNARWILGIVYFALDYFCPALKSAIGDAAFEKYGQIFISLAELAELTIDGWTFDVSSRQWANDTQPTILIIKFAEDDIEALTKDLSRWTMPWVFNDDASATQQRLLNIFASARQNVAVEPDLQYFVDTVLANRQPGGFDVWNGVLYLNAVVPTNAFPPDLAALAAGLPSTQLRAHHLGVTLSSFDTSTGAIRLADSSLFGLILYEDTTDLIYKGNPYDFKVLSLKVLFANSKITSFSSQVELLVAQLFAELSTLEGSLHGDNILFDGTLDNGTYRFSTQSENVFRVDSKVVDGVTVNSAQFVTLTDQSTVDRTVALFILNGNMTFRKLDFDLFGFGPMNEGLVDPVTDGQLRFSNLLVSMDFNPNKPTDTRTFVFQANQMVFDPSGTRARPGSLPRRFPLVAFSMLQSEAVVDEKGRQKSTIPADFGFIPVASPLIPGTLGSTWFGLQMTLSFGSPGALAPKLGFTGALLASWAPSQINYNVAIGLRLPGSEAGKKSLTIMGPLKLSIGQLLFLYDNDTEGYLLRFQNIALSFLGLSFPPGGKTNATLFGDPDPQSTSSTLGWYLAYQKDKKKKDGDQGTGGKPRLAKAPAARQLPAADSDCPPCRKRGDT